MCRFCFVCSLQATFTSASFRLLSLLFVCFSPTVFVPGLFWFVSVYLVATAGFVVCVCVCVCVCVFIKLHITTQSGPVILVIPCHSHWSSRGGMCVCVCVYLLNCT